MVQYRDNPQAVRALVQDDRVHRDVYLSEEVFALETEQLHARSWVYLGHESQVREPGDYITTEIAGRSLIMVRQADRTIRVLMNRCAHKGAKVVTERSGSTGCGFRCPYHAWAYRLDGAPAGVPLRQGYEGTRLNDCESGRGLVRVPNSVNYRGFLFIRLSEDGQSFEEYFKGALFALDNLADRSPLGELEVAGECIRSEIRCNWKIYLENINDTVHAPVTHESSAMSAKAVWDEQPEDAPKPMAMELLLPFGGGYDFAEKMGSRVFANGHSVLGTNASLHSAYSSVPEYEASMVEAYGEERAHAILSFAPQNSVFYPSMAVKASPQTLRVLRPLGPDRTLLEVWAFRPKGAPDVLVQRTLSYNRLVFSPLSIVAHDDIQVFETIQRSLRSPGNDWVSLHRGFRAEEMASVDYASDGANEVLMRNQYRGWVKQMTAGMREAGAVPAARVVNA